MSISSYPSGFRGGALIKETALYDTIDGNVYWVDSGSGGAGNSGQFLSPVATIDQAINKCTNNNNDIIYIKAGHAETIADATSLVADIAGVTIIGLGRGTSRPTLTFSAAASSIPVSAANVTFQNFVMTANFADVAAAFTPTGKNLTVSDVVFNNGGTNLNWVNLAAVATTDNNADGLTFSRCHFFEIDTAVEAVADIDVDIDGLTIEDCYVDLGINGVLSSLVEVAAGKDTTNIDLRANYVSRLVTASAVQLITWVDTTTTNTGIAAWNRSRTLDIAGELLATAGSNTHFANNLSTSAIDKSGYSLPTADS